MEALLDVNVAMLEDHFKAREASIEPRISGLVAVRLDGVGFGKALSGYEEPRDPVVHEALCAACRAIIERYSLLCGYVSSDEINVIVQPQALPYAGRVEKLVSVFSGIASSVASLGLGRRAFFDARVIPLEDFDEARTYVLWRARVCMNNYISKVLHMLGCNVRGGIKERLRAFLEVSSKHRFLVEPWRILGSSVTWSRVLVPARDKCSGEEVVVERRRLVVSEGYRACLDALEQFRSALQ